MRLASFLADMFALVHATFSLARVHPLGSWLPKDGLCASWPRFACSTDHFLATLVIAARRLTLSRPAFVRALFTSRTTCFSIFLCFFLFEVTLSRLDAADVAAIFALRAGDDDG